MPTWDLTALAGTCLVLGLPLTVFGFLRPSRLGLVAGGAAGMAFSYLTGFSIGFDAALWPLLAFVQVPFLGRRPTTRLAAMALAGAAWAVGLGASHLNR